MTSIERTAYPRFKRLITAREPHLFFSPGLEEAQWAAERTEPDEHQLALLLMLKSYQRMGCFPKLGEVPDTVVDFARRALNLPEGTRAAHASVRSAEQHRALLGGTRKVSPALLALIRALRAQSSGTRTR